MGILSKIFKEYEDRIEVLEDKVKFIESRLVVDITPIIADTVIGTPIKVKPIVAKVSSTSEGKFNIEAGIIKDVPPLGSLSKKYESGRSGAGTVSSGRGDPGGVSYGTYQLASKTGTCARFIRTMKYTTYFKGNRPGTAAFSALWKKLAKATATDAYVDGGRNTFADDQHEFIKRTHYDPVRKHAIVKGIIDHHAVNQVLWSIGVQHGRAKSIVTTAVKLGANGEFVDNIKGTINKLYDAREAYVRRIKLPSGTRRSLLNRYKSERKEALAMV